MKRRRANNFLEQLELLVRAIEGHAAGAVSEDPTIACCWYGDRLEFYKQNR
jgi:hypothetical protein